LYGFPSPIKIRYESVLYRPARFGAVKARDIFWREEYRDLAQAQVSHECIRLICEPACEFTECPAELGGWHNPNGLTAEQVEVDKGWRLRTSLEIKHLRQPEGSEYWSETLYGRWTKSAGSNTGYYASDTYRTQEPLPALRYVRYRRPHAYVQAVCLLAGRPIQAYGSVPDPLKYTIEQDFDFGHAIWCGCTKEEFEAAALRRLRLSDAPDGSWVKVTEDDPGSLIILRQPGYTWIGSTRYSNDVSIYSWRALHTDKEHKTI
jgi:hypothetical protein